MSRVHAPVRPPSAPVQAPMRGAAASPGMGMAHTRGEATCWNCDAVAPAIVPVTVQAPAGGHTVLRLCRACWAPHLLPLAGAGWELHLVPGRDGGRSQ